MPYSTVPLLLVVWACVAAVVEANGADWYYQNWCGAGNMQYLQDASCAKLFPSNVGRDWTCKLPLLSTVPDGYQPETALLDVSVDTTTLGAIVADPDINLCLIMTKRVSDSTAAQGFRLYNRYFCAGDRSALVPYETWSSSKVFAMANAGGRLRSNETGCGAGDAHNHLFGLDGSVTGSHGYTKLGDLATVICSYDHTAGYTSNSLASYFHDIGWRQRLYDNVQNWLLVSEASSPQPTSATTLRERLHAQNISPTSAVQSLGGNYGEATPSDLSFNVSSTEVDQTSDCAVDKDPRPVTYTNTLSALSAAELVRRLALHRELPPHMRFPNATWTDIQTILYGAEESVFFPGQVWGGMSADIAIFTQAGLDLPILLQQWDPLDQEQWRIFSKLGDGIELDHGEIVSNAYACIPRYNEVGEAIGGIEFTIAARGSVLGDSSLKLTEQQLFAAMSAAIQFALTQA